VLTGDEQHRRRAFAVMTALVDPDDDIDRAFVRLAELIGPGEAHADVRFSLLGPEGTTHRYLRLGPDGAAVQQSGPARPDLEFLLRSETWESIGRGDLSLLEAFLTGRLRVRGDVGLAKSLSRRLVGDTTGTVDSRLLG
jgi:hypothetical protein